MNPQNSSQLENFNTACFLWNKLRSKTILQNYIAPVHTWFLQNDHNCLNSVILYALTTGVLISPKRCITLSI